MTTHTSAKEITERHRIGWKAATAIIVAIAGTSGLIGAGTERYVGKRDHVDTESLQDSMRSLIREELEPLRNEIAALKTRTTLNEAEIVGVRQQVIAIAPKLDTIVDKLATVAEKVSAIDERTRRQ